MNQDLLDAVARVLGEPAGGLVGTHRFQGDLVFDSVMMIELKCALEERVPRLADASLADLFDGVSTISDLRERLAVLCGQPVA
ncbi:phosphopantetheine-binding protein [Streptomyces sp. NPDC048441]|uniref:phosphopantetheine-binding protein n=1 Tax=Streptomyces sp. NPDC048441 TaxID=3365552 RepID=UPI00371F6FCF